MVSSGKGEWVHPPAARTCSLELSLAVVPLWLQALQNPSLPPSNLPARGQAQPPCYISHRQKRDVSRYSLPFLLLLSPLFPLLSLSKNLFFFFFFASTTWHMYLKSLNQESNPHPLQWKHGVLTIGLPGKPLPSFHQQHLLLLLSRRLQVYILIIPAQYAFSFS